MMRGAGLKRKSKAASEIPACSLADMAFLLLIFFMVTTTFRKEERQPVVFPAAEATQKLEEPRKDVLHIYVLTDGTIFINDRNVPPAEVAATVRPIAADNKALVVMVRSDRDAPYQRIDQVLQQLAQAGAYRVAFYTSLEERLLGEGR
jgi:biopolymer transport protein ExbD